MPVSSYNGQPLVLLNVPQDNTPVREILTAAHAIRDSLWVPQLDIVAGTSRHEEISRAVDTGDATISFISPDFLADAAYNGYAQKARTHARVTGGAVLGVYLRASDLDGLEVNLGIDPAALLPAGKKPLATFEGRGQRDEQIQNIVQAMKARVAEAESKRKRPVREERTDNLTPQMQPSQTPPSFDSTIFPGWSAPNRGPDRRATDLEERERRLATREAQLNQLSSNLQAERARNNVMFQQLQQERVALNEWYVEAVNELSQKSEELARQERELANRQAIIEAAEKRLASSTDGLPVSGQEKLNDEDLVVTLGQRAQRLEDLGYDPTRVQIHFIARDDAAMYRAIAGIMGNLNAANWGGLIEMTQTNDQAGATRGPRPTHDVKEGDQEAERIQYADIIACCLDAETLGGMTYNNVIRKATDTLAAYKRKHGDMQKAYRVLPILVGATALPLDLMSLSCLPVGDVAINANSASKRESTIQAVALGIKKVAQDMARDKLGRKVNS